MSKWREAPEKVRPMLASLDEPPIAQAGFLYEPKYDGIRALVDLRPPAHVALYSRNGHDKTRQFPAIADALGSLARRLDAPLLLDGEIVAVDPEGRPLGFGDIQGRIHLTSPGDIARAEAAQPAVLILFDLLRDGGDDIRGQTLAARRLRLQERIRPRGKAASRVRLSEVVLDDGRALLDRAHREDWEGLIVKDGQSVYQSGRRTPAWRKLKLHKQQEFVVGGWTPPRQSRAHFGALLVGTFDQGRLHYAGSVGTGFDTAELERVKTLLDARPRATSPFDDVPRAIARTAHWVRPDLVVEVRFTEWTSDGLLRHPVYLGRRTDKAAREVGSESPPPRVAAGLDTVIARLHALEDSRKDGDVELPNGDRLRVTNLWKVFWPTLGITKGDLLRFYTEVSPLLLPAVDDRPMVMKRFPNGIERQAFYQQRHPEAVPAGVRRELLPESVDPIDPDEGSRERLIGGSLTTLLYMTQLAAISQDPWFSRVADPLHPDQVAIDLDPGDGAGFAEALDVARWVKDELDRFGVPGLPKTSGSRGLHIYIPLSPGTTYETGQLLCQMIATVVAEAHPRVATVERMVRRRPRGTVYVDYLQNILGKTLATAYSARASDYAGVSTPLTWTEVAEGVDPHDFTVRTAASRFAEVGDLWAPLRTGRTVDLRSVLSRGARPAATRAAGRGRRAGARKR